MTPCFRPPRTAPFAAVAALHVAAVAAIVAAPGVSERISPPSPVFVDYRVAAREKPPEPAPLPAPRLRDPAPVALALPAIVLAPEINAPVPLQIAAAPSVPPSAPAASQVPVAQAAPAIESPRFDMAYLRNPPPAYPALSRRMKEEGRVILRVLVSAGGDAENVEVRTSSGSERLDRAAIEAVRRWRFAPAHRGAEAIAAYALVPILFQLNT